MAGESWMVTKQHAVSGMDDGSEDDISVVLHIIAATVSSSAGGLVGRLFLPLDGLLDSARSRASSR